MLCRHKAPRYKLGLLQDFDRETMVIRVEVPNVQEPEFGPAYI